MTMRMNQKKLQSIWLVNSGFHSDPWGRKCAIGQLEINRTIAKDGNQLNHGKTTMYNFQVQKFEYDNCWSTCTITRTN